jgi:hypothetical protein
MIVRYTEKEGVFPANIGEVKSESLIRSIKETLVEHGEWEPYAAIRHGRHVLLDAMKIKRLKNRVVRFMLDKDLLDEAAFLCSTTEGRRRRRLTGGGKKKSIPDALAYLVYSKLHLLTLLNGKVTNNEIVQAMKDFSPAVPGLAVLSPGEELPAGSPQDSKMLLLTTLALHRFRKRFHMKTIRGESKTSLDPIAAMHAGFDSQVRVRAARLLGIKLVSNTDQSMIMLERGATEKAYATRRTGAAGGQKKLKERFET